MNINDYPKVYKFNWGAALESEEWAKDNGCSHLVNERWKMMLFYFFILSFINIVAVNNGLARMVYGILIIALSILLGLLHSFLVFGFNSYRLAKASGKYENNKELYLAQEKWQQRGYDILKKNSITILLNGIIVLVILIGILLNYFKNLAAF